MPMRVIATQHRFAEVLRFSAVAVPWCAHARALGVPFLRPKKTAKVGRARRFAA